MLPHIEALLILLMIICGLAVVAQKLNFPFPILLVISGVLIAMIPGLPVIRMNSEVIFFVFLPPILFSAAWLFSWEELWVNRRPIFLLAVGLVFFTIVCVGFAGAWLVSGLTLGAAFVLGTIISPPDAVAAEAVLGRMHMPRRLMSVLQGESLVNDASGLVAYHFAVIAVMTGTFSLIKAGGDFVVVSIGGIVTGLICGVIVAFVNRFVKDSAVEITLSLITAYGSYLAADKFGFSGVLSTVTTGIFLGYRSSDLSASTRLQARAFWEVVNYILDGLIFIMIGLQFPSILESLKGYPWWKLGLYALWIYLIITVARYAWIYGLSFLVRRRRGVHYWKEHFFSNKTLAVVGWAGMRGVVSLATALALQEKMPCRDLLLFLTFAIIFLTIVFNGLTLPALVRLLGVHSVGIGGYRHQLEIQIGLFESMLVDLDKIQARDGEAEASRSASRMLRKHFQERLDWLTQMFRKDEDATGKEVKMSYSAISDEIMNLTRKRLEKMWRDGSISDNIHKRVGSDIDIEEQRLRQSLGE